MPFCRECRKFTALHFSSWQLLHKFIFKSDEEITRSERYRYIDKQTFLPVKTQAYAEYKGIQQEYKELVIKNLVGIKHKNATIHHDFLPMREPDAFDAARKTAEVPLLKEGTAAPQFTGRGYNETEFMNLKTIIEQHLSIAE